MSWWSHCFSFVINRKILKTYFDDFHNMLQMESKILCKDQYYICISFINFSGNQLDGIVIHDEEMLARWNKAYPNGYDLVKGLTLHSRLTP